MKHILLATIFLLTLKCLAFSQQTQPVPDNFQANSPNILDQITLRFDVEATPKPENVGFDNPKSNWKLAYELRLSDEKTLDELHSGLYKNCRQNTPEYQKCVSKTNKIFDRKSKKATLLILKGIFEKKDLSIKANRQMLIPVSFTPNVIEIFNRAAQTQENPTFILLIKSKVSAKPSNQKKYKRKMTLGFQYPLKLIRKDGSFDYYNITTFGASVRVDKDENGGIGYGIFKN